MQRKTALFWYTLVRYRLVIDLLGVAITQLFYIAPSTTPLPKPSKEA